MGGLWSHPEPQETELTVVRPTQLTRKRPRSPETQLPTDFTSPSVLNRKPPAISIDDTPDGDSHRFIVRCSSIFWCTRKDMIKILGKVPAFPPYGGLHKVTKWDYFFITFPNKACAEKGVSCLNAFTYRGVRWEASPTTEHSAKRVRIDQSITNVQKKSVTFMPEGVCKTAADVTAKWRDLPYEEQIKRKTNKWTTALSMVTKQMKRELKGRDCLPWLNQLTKDGTVKGSPVCCPLKHVVTANTPEERLYYRNKNEFTVGTSPDCCGLGHNFHKSEVTIGYALGLVRNGQVFVGPLDKECVTTSITAREIASCLAPVIKRLQLPPYDKQTHKGYWRQITCREGRRTGQVIVSVVVNPDAIVEAAGDGLRVSDKDCQDAVVRALCEHMGSHRNFGIFWQPSSHVSALSSDIPAIHLFGLRDLTEEMCGLRFRIQPTAFFQVNTVMAEKLYSLIGDMARVSAETAVFDVCCGTGTIGLSLARRAHSVVGIEMSEAAIADAVYNAKANGIDNATFIAGKVENKIHEAIQRIDGNRECVAILDPPRAGLPMNVVAAVRAMKSVHRIVYVACEPNNFWKNALGFLRPRSKTFRLEPFRPVMAYGLDLFPHTDHGELAILLEREVVEND